MSEPPMREVPLDAVGPSLLFTILAALALGAWLGDALVGLLVGVALGLGFAYANGWRGPGGRDE